MKYLKFKKIVLLVGLVALMMVLIYAIYYAMTLVNTRKTVTENNKRENVVSEYDMSSIPDVDYSQYEDLLKGVKKGSLDGEVASVNKQSISLKTVSDGNNDYFLSNDVKVMLFDRSGFGYVFFPIDYLVQGMNVSLEVDKESKVGTIYVYPTQTIRGDVLKIIDSEVTVKNIFDEKEYNINFDRNFLVFNSAGENKTAYDIVEGESVLLISNKEINRGFNSGWLMLVD